MDAFESLMAMLLKRDGYWTTTSFKVLLTREEKIAIGRPSSPRPEIDVLAYRGKDNHLLVVECKSFLDSLGVIFADGSFQPATRYKMFSDDVYRNVVLGRLVKQCHEAGLCPSQPTVQLCLAAGHIASRTNRNVLKQHFDESGWLVFDEDWIVEAIRKAATAGYENDVAHVVAKIILRRKRL